MHKQNLTISVKGLDLIKRFEGLRLHAYYCPAGLLTVGYGHVIKKHERLSTITQWQADQLLRDDVKAAEVAVNGFVRVPLNQSQFDALVSFVFNIGAVKFKQSTLLRYLNNGEYVAAGLQLMRWTKVRNPKTNKFEDSNGLRNRRLAELSLYQGLA